MAFSMETECNNISKFISYLTGHVMPIHLEKLKDKYEKNEIIFLRNIYFQIMDGNSSDSTVTNYHGNIFFLNIWE